MIEEEELISNPFPGLRPFEQEEDYLFFGRETQIDNLLKKLRENRFLAVVGASGSGKSSLVKCGLFPSLHGGMMSGAGTDWHIIIFRPGSNPIRNLAEAIAGSDLYQEDNELGFETNATIVEASLRRSNNGITDTLSKFIRPEKKENILIMVDQFEELFRFNQQEKYEKKNHRDSRNFIDLLLSAYTQTKANIFVSFTMRSEFLGDCTEFRGLPEAINKGQYLIPRLTREELKETIIGPASVGGAEISSRLLNRFLNDVGENPDQLPILQHALMRTWEHWKHNNKEGTLLDLQNYEAIGTMKSALSQHAEEAFRELNGQTERRVCERMFKSLTERNRKNQGIRRPLSLELLTKSVSSEKETVIKVIDIFRAQGRSFLVPSYEIELQDDAVVDISHESLMRVWDRLIDWVTEESEAANTYNKLCESALLFQQGKTSVWVDPDLQVAINWRNESSPNLVWASRYNAMFEQAIQFLEYCASEKEQEIRKKELAQQIKMRRARIFTAVLGVATIVTLVFAMISVSLKFKSDENALEAKNQKERALVEKELAEEQRQIAEEQRKLAEQQRQIAFANERLAEVRSKEATLQRNIAEKERLTAVQQRKLAVRAREFAEKQRIIANEQRENAIKEKQISDSLTLVAEQAKNEANRLRMLDISTKLAAYSKSLSSNQPELSSMLSLLAYKFNMDNKGYPYESIIFDALSNPTDEESILLNGIFRSAINYRKNELLILYENGRIITYNTITKKQSVFIHNTLPNARRLMLTGKILVVQDAYYNIYVQNVETEDKSMITNVNTPITLIENNIAYLSNNKLITLNSYSIDDSAFEGVYLFESVGKNKLLMANKNNQLFIYDLKNNTIENVATYENKVTEIEYNKMDNRVVIGLTSGTLEVFRMDDFQHRKPLSIHESAITSVKFSKDGKFILTTSFDKTIKMMNIDFLEHEPMVIGESNSWVWGADFLGSPKQILVVANDNTLRSYSISIGKLVKDLCTKQARNLTEEEWNIYIGNDIPKINVCEDLMANSQISAN